MNEWALRPAAADDLDGIADYTESRWDADQADTYLKTLRSMFDSLAADTWRGTGSSKQHPSLRTYRCQAHIILFERHDGGIDIVRVLHHRMDWRRHIG